MTIHIFGIITHDIGLLVDHVVTARSQSGLELQAFGKLAEIMLGSFSSNCSKVSHYLIKLLPTDEY